jgi:hypothetical protein
MLMQFSFVEQLDISSYSDGEEEEIPLLPWMFMFPRQVQVQTQTFAFPPQFGTSTNYVVRCPFPSSTQSQQLTKPKEVVKIFYTLLDETHNGLE